MPKTGNDMTSVNWAGIIYNTSKDWADIVTYAPESMSYTVINCSELKSRKPKSIYAA